MRLHRLVERPQRRVGRGELRDVRRLGGVLTAVEQLGRPRGHQPASGTLKEYANGGTTACAETAKLVVDRIAAGHHERAKLSI